MALATLGRCNSQLKASSNRSWPRASQKSDRRSTTAQFRSVSRRSAARGVVVNRAPPGIGALRRDLPVSSPSPRGGNGDNPRRELRSGERRVGGEGGSRGWRGHLKKKKRKK